MSADVCSVDGCDRLVVSRGWCGMHYQRWYHHGDPMFQRPKADPVCSVPGCGRVRGNQGGHGLCAAHYNRWRAGDVRADVPIGSGSSPRSTFDPANPDAYARVAQIDQPTFAMMDIRVSGISSHFKLRLRSKGSGYARLANVAVHYT